MGAQQPPANGCRSPTPCAWRPGRAPSSPAPRLRTAQAQARVTQSRAALLPNISASAVESGHTINSATFGFNFPSQPGQPPLLDPLGQIIGPVSTLDLRGSVSQTLFDAGALQHYRGVAGDGGMR